MKERVEKDARFMKLNRLFTNTKESISFELRNTHADRSHDTTLDAARVEYDRISTLVDEVDILCAVARFNQVMFPWEIIYSKQITQKTRDPEYYDEEIHAIEHIARNIDLISAFDKACVDVDLLNSREPMDKFQEVLLNKFIDTWFDENMSDVISKLEESSLDSVFDSDNRQDVVDFLFESGVKPALRAFFNELQKAGMTLPEDSIHQFVETASANLVMLSEITEKATARMSSGESLRM